MLRRPPARRESATGKGALRRPFSMSFPCFISLLFAAGRPPATVRRIAWTVGNLRVIVAASCTPASGPGDRWIRPV